MDSLFNFLCFKFDMTLERGSLCSVDISFSNNLNLCRIIAERNFLELNETGGCHLSQNRAILVGLILGEINTMKKLKNEKELVKKAIAAGMKYGEDRGVVEFEPTDSAADKIEYIYRLLVHDKIINPLPQDQVNQVTMKHRLAIWASKIK